MSDDKNVQAAETAESPFQKFKDFTRRLLAVPKSEIVAKEKQLKRNKARRKRRSA
jgi:hypothetical protein